MLSYNSPAFRLRPMELFLIREDLWSIIEQEIPDAKDDTYKAWKIKNDKARATIGLIVDET
jgi:hypothetical protein